MVTEPSPAVATGFNGAPGTVDGVIDVAELATP
jgi:hypothetical protein